MPLLSSRLKQYQRARKRIAVFGCVPRLGRDDVGYGDSTFQRIEYVHAVSKNDATRGEGLKREVTRPLAMRSVPVTAVSPATRNLSRRDAVYRSYTMPIVASVCSSICLALRLRIAMSWARSKSASRFSGHTA